eukprot:CAMPEP_0170589008 /NCGR_PEP_ID=MMETSP0224-20130122/11129_1 /TAXON_ID=285029 /ORGANISM="Togula jolla, Strain CCCM 725" /LENGTH=269 /DNA_ID=CAMNT_0010912753 /DNA_START=61 /DNA_END=870 /DNA_ORIENTATION=-
MPYVSRAKRRNGVRAAAASALDRRFFKTKLCTFFAEGKCSRGSRCTYAHAETEVSTSPDLFHTQPCREHFLKGSCEQGDACPFAHKVEDLRTVPSQTFYQLPGILNESLNNAASPSSTSADHTATERLRYGSDCGSNSASTTITKGSSWRNGNISRQSTEDIHGGCALSEFAESDQETWEGADEKSASTGRPFQRQRRQRLGKMSLADISTGSDEGSPPALDFFIDFRRAVSENAADGGRLELVMKNTFLEAVESIVPGASRRSASAGP